MRYGHIIMPVICAWVLWKQGVLGTSEQWRLFEAVPTREECLNHGQKEYLANVMFPDPGTKITNENYEYLAFTSGEARIAYKCLPDTVDPRAPKAK